MTHNNWQWWRVYSNQYCIVWCVRIFLGKKRKRQSKRKRDSRDTTTDPRWWWLTDDDDERIENALQFLFCWLTLPMHSMPVRSHIQMTMNEWRAISPLHMYCTVQYLCCHHHQRERERERSLWVSWYFDCGCLAVAYIFRNYVPFAVERKKEKEKERPTRYFIAFLSSFFLLRSVSVLFVVCRVSTKRSEAKRKQTKERVLLCIWCDVMGSDGLCGIYISPLQSNQITADPHAWLVLLYVSLSL